MGKVWQWTDSDGVRRTSRGAANKKEMIQHGQQLLDAIRRRAIGSGEEDPKLTVVPESVESIGESNAPEGGWIPIGGRQVDLDRKSRRDEFGEPIRPAPARSPHPRTTGEVESAT